MALAAGRAWLESATVELQNFEIPRSLVLDPDSLVEVTTRISPESGTVEILSRPRLHDGARTLHAFGRISAIPTRTAPAAPAPGEPISALEPSRLYALAHACGLDYGPTFQCAERIATLADGRIRITMRRDDGSLVAAADYGVYPPPLPTPLTP